MVCPLARVLLVKAQPFHFLLSTWLCRVLWWYGECCPRTFAVERNMLWKGTFLECFGAVGKVFVPMPVLVVVTACNLTHHCSQLTQVLLHKSQYPRYTSPKRAQTLFMRSDVPANPIFLLCSCLDLFCQMFLIRVCIIGREVVFTVF